MEPGDALQVLGIPGPAGPDEVKRAYRELARRLHPDAGGDADHFRRIQRAYEVVRGGTDARADGPRAQVHHAGVDQRWWESAGAWHEQRVPTGGVSLDVRPQDRATRTDLDLLASLLHDPGDGPVRTTTLHSRAPGSRLHRIVSWLQPDLLATIDARPAPDGRRPGHDVRVRVTAAGGRGRRLLGDVQVPTGWTRRRGSDTVTIARDLRPSRTTDETAVRVAREIDQVTHAIGWPLDDWFVLTRPTQRPTT